MYFRKTKSKLKLKTTHFPAEMEKRNLLSGYTAIRKMEDDKEDGKCVDLFDDDDDDDNDNAADYANPNRGGEIIAHLYKSVKISAPLVETLAIVGGCKFNLKNVDGNLKDNMWLDDESVNAYMFRLQESISNDKDKRVVMFSTFFMQKLANEKAGVGEHGTINIGAVSRWDKNCRGKELDFILTVYNVEMFHWVGFELDIQHKVANCYNSMPSRSHASLILLRLKMLVRWFVEHRLSEDWDEGNNCDAKQEWKFNSEATYPKQSNSYDCGVWALFALRSRLYPMPPYDPSMQFEMRRSVVEAIFTKFNKDDNFGIFD